MTTLAEQMFDEATEIAVKCAEVVEAILNRVPYAKLTQEQQKTYLGYTKMILAEVLRREARKNA
jgi:hypothetical protein